MKKSELKNLTLTELKSYAKEKNIKKYSKLNKEELINYIINYKKIIKGGANGNENSNAKTNITVASNNTLMSNINKKQKLQDCYEKLDVLSQFYLFYSKINVYFNLYNFINLTLYIHIFIINISLFLSIICLFIIYSSKNK